MEQNKVQATTGITFRILVALSICHCLNDTLQSVISAVYPLFKEDLGLSFAQIGLITLVYQSAASVCQPLTGLFFDKWPSAWSLPTGMSFTLVGLLSLAFANTLPLVLCSVALVGIGSSVFHPEASRLTSLASGGKRGLAQSLFQVGGNLGGNEHAGKYHRRNTHSFHQLYGRRHIALFTILAFTAIMVMIPVGHWYKSFLLRLRKAEGETLKTSVSRPLPMGKTVFSIAILLILIFSKYIYMASLNSYYTFYLIHKFGVSVQASQLYLFVFLIATAIGTLLGGPIGDRVGRKYVIWASILGAAPFTLIMPHVENLYLTTVLSFCVGLTLSSAFPAILVYAQELLPYKLGLISGLFFGFAFGVAGIASAVLGNMADRYGIEAVYNVCGYMPLIGLVTWFLPDLKKKR